MKYFFSKYKLRSFAILIGGILLLTCVLAVSAHHSLRYAEELRQSTVDMLAQQCVSFENIKNVDRTRSLFRIHENISELSHFLARNPALATDAYLEEYVDSMQLSGVSLLNEDLQLEASGYTRALRTEDWQERFYPGCFESIVAHPEQSILERILIDGQYYDVCAVSRRDRAGVLVAYFEQPMSRIYDTENDLKQLLKNIHMELSGDFIIMRNGSFITENPYVSDVRAFCALADAQCCADGLKKLHFEGISYYATRTVSGENTIYIYFPASAVFSNTLIILLVAFLLYVGFLLSIFLIRAHSVREKQRQLERTDRKLRESNSVVQSLQSIFFTAFYLDITTGHYESIFITPWLLTFIPASGDFTKAAQTVLHHCVPEKYHRELSRQISVEYIREQLNQQNISETRHSFYFDYEVLRSKKISWARITVTLVDEDANGDPAHVLVLLQDVNEEKRREVAYQEQILKEAAAAESANRAKSSFLFNMSHDMRTPMNAILGYTTLAKKHLDDPQRLQKYMGNIQISGERMLSLINDVLELARIENSAIVLDERATRVGNGIEACIVMIKPAADEKEQTIHLTKNVIHPYAYIDHPHMSQVVLNILGNAVKYTDRGGRIDVTVNQLPSERAGYFITELIIADNGIGMSTEFLPHIYEAFSRERSVTVSGISGTGLGMGIVKRLVELMDGTIDIKSAPKKGTTFTLRIPHRIATAQDAAIPPPEYHTAAFTDKRVLLAEDNDLNAEIAMELMQEEGILAARARDGAECIEMLQRGDYDMILMDIQMPVLDGYAATARIRKLADAKKANIPIVAMTANAFPEDRRRALAVGMNDHIAKPIDSNAIMMMFQKYLNASLENTQSGGNSHET